MRRGRRARPGRVVPAGAGRARCLVVSLSCGDQAAVGASISSPRRQPAPSPTRTGRGTAPAQVTGALAMAASISKPKRQPAPTATAAHGRNCLDQRRQLGDVVTVAAGQRHGQGDAPPVSDHVMLAASTRCSGRSNPTRPASSGASNRLSCGGAGTPEACPAKGSMGANRGSQPTQIRPDPQRRPRNITADGRLSARLLQTAPGRAGSRARNGAATTTAPPWPPRGRRLIRVTRGGSATENRPGLIRWPATAPMSPPTRFGPGRPPDPGTETMTCQVRAVRVAAQPPSPHRRCGCTT